MAARRLFTLDDSTFGQLGDDVLGGLGTGYTEGTSTVTSDVLGSAGRQGTTGNTSTVTGSTLGVAARFGSGGNSHLLVSTATGVEGSNGAATGSVTVSSQVAGAITVTGSGSNATTLSGTAQATPDISGSGTTTVAHTSTVIGQIATTGSAVGSHTTTGTATGSPDIPPTPEPPKPFTRSGGWRRYQPQQPPPPDVPTILFGNARHTSTVTHQAAGVRGQTGTAGNRHAVTRSVTGERWPTDQMIQRWRDNADLILLEVF